MLRLGKFRDARRTGTVLHRPDCRYGPLPDRHSRVITTTFKAEKTMTRDTVPVDVDAVLFWKVVDPKMAALDVAD